MPSLIKSETAIKFPALDFGCFLEFPQVISQKLSLLGNKGLKRSV